MPSIAIEHALKTLEIHVEEPQGIQEERVKGKQRWLRDQIIGPLHQAAYAESQDAYETAYDRIFASLDQLEETFAQSRYLLGDEISAADVELYSVLARFDVVYFYAFHLNRNKISDFPHLFRYAKELYGRPEFKAVTDFEEIKRTYYTELDDVKNPYHIIPQGPDMSIWDE